MDTHTRRSLRLLFLPAIGLISFCFWVTNLVFMATDIEYTVIDLSSFKLSARAAAMLNALTALSTILVCVSEIFNLKPRWIFKAIFGWLGALVGLTAAIVTLNVLILKKLNPQLMKNLDAKIGLSTDLELVIWTLSALFGLVFFTSFGILSGSQRDEEANTDAASESSFKGKEYRKPPPRPATPPSPLRLAEPSQYVPETTMTSLESVASQQAHSRGSMESLQHPVVSCSQRQYTNRTSYHGSSATARSSLSRDIKSVISLDIKPIGHSTGSMEATELLHWDTSGSEAPIRENFATSSSRRPAPLLLGTALETIPGSQPASPAKPFNMLTEMEGYISSFGSDHDQAVQIPASSFRQSKSHVRNTDRCLTNFQPSAKTSGRLSTTVNASTNVSMENLLDCPPALLAMSDRPPTSLSTHSRMDSDYSTIYADHALGNDYLPNLPRPSTARSNNSSRRPAISSRPETPLIAEAHIHPLFRTDSPTPPPTTSANTNVLASPFSGQVIGHLPVHSMPVTCQYPHQGRSRSNSYNPDDTRSNIIPIPFAGHAVARPESAASSGYSTSVPHLMSSYTAPPGSIDSGFLALIGTTGRPLSAKDHILSNG